MNKASAISRFVCPAPASSATRRSVSVRADPGRTAGGHAIELGLGPFHPHLGTEPGEKFQRGLECRPRGALLTRPAEDIAEREPGTCRPERDLQVGVDPHSLLRVPDGPLVVTFRCQEQRRGSGHLRGRRRPRTTTSPSLHGIQEASSLIESSETDEEIGGVRHDRLPVQRSQSAESRFGYDLRKPYIGRRGVANEWSSIARDAWTVDRNHQ